MSRATASLVDGIGTAYVHRALRNPAKFKTRSYRPIALQRMGNHRARVGCDRACATPCIQISAPGGSALLFQLTGGKGRDVRIRQSKSTGSCDGLQSPANVALDLSHHPRPGAVQRQLVTRFNGCIDAFIPNATPAATTITLRPRRNPICLHGRAGGIYGTVTSL